MKAFILCAGYGKRLQPLTKRWPKPLIPVLNLPSICYSLFLIKEAGIEEVVCNLHYRAGEIIQFFKENDFFGLNVSFSIEEELLGTGGGLKRCEELLSGEEFVLINSDIITNVNLTDLIESHRSSATLLVYRSKRASEIGRVGIVGSRVVDFENMLGSERFSDFVYTGVAVVEPSIFRYLKSSYSSIVDTGFTGLIKNHSIGFFEHRGFWMDIGSIDRYWNANIKRRDEILGLKSRIEDMLGLTPSMIDRPERIEKSSVIRDSVIGRDVEIGTGAVVEECVILPNSTVGSYERVSGCIVYPDGMIEVRDSSFEVEAW